MKAPSPTAAAIVSATTTVAAAAVRLSAPPFSPEEAAFVTGNPGRWALLTDLAASLGAWPETAARLPSVVLTALAAALLARLLARHTNGWAALLLVATNPALVATARSAEPRALGLLLGVLALWMFVEAPRRWLPVATALTLGGGLVTVRSVSASADPVLAAATATWGLLATEAIPPWRPDVALPLIVCVVALSVLGIAGPWWRRLGIATIIATAAATLGWFAQRPGHAAGAAITLTPALLYLVARGAQSLPVRIPRWPLVALCLAVGFVGTANLHVARDVVDPARRVLWDEAARMVAQISKPNGVVVVGKPDLPTPITLYAKRALPIATTPRTERMLIVSHGLAGGLERPGHRLGRALEARGFRLRGEMEMGAIEPGLARMLRALGRTPPNSYLRVRRYERRLD